MDALRSNPYTYKVTQCQLSFTTEFKELFWKHYNEGMTPRDILLSLGYDPNMLGDNRGNDMTVTGLPSEANLVLPKYNIHLFRV